MNRRRPDASGVNPSEAVLRTRRLARVLRRALPRVPDLVSAMREHQAGYSSTASGATSTGGGPPVEDPDLVADGLNGEPHPPHSDPTGAAAVVFDRARDDERRLVQALNDGLRAAAVLEDLLAAYLGAKPLSPNDLAHLHNVNADPGCRSCARCRRDDGNPWFTPCERDHNGAIVKADGSTSTYRVRVIDGQRVRVPPQGSVLVEPWPLCRWCREILEESRALPPLTAVDAHVHGRLVRRKAG